jgi:uncharacterized protein YuzE
MRLTYDRSVDAAYLYFTKKPGSVKRTYVCDPTEIGGMINLDFDKDGRLLGVEVLGASQRLPAELLEQAEIIG